jgi:hypothetical protein
VASEGTPTLHIPSAIQAVLSSARALQLVLRHVDIEAEGQDARTDTAVGSENPSEIESEWLLGADRAPCNGDYLTDR